MNEPHAKFCSVHLQHVVMLEPEVGLLRVSCCLLPPLMLLVLMLHHLGDTRLA